MATTKLGRARKKTPTKPLRQDVGQLKRLIEVLEFIDELVEGSPGDEVAAIQGLVEEAAALIESAGLADIAAIPESSRPVVFEVEEDDRGNLRFRWEDPDPKWRDQQRDGPKHIRASMKRWRRLALIAIEQAQPLAGKAKEAADYITAHPGETGNEIAVAIHTDPSYFRSMFTKKLEPKGFYNAPGTTGYHPPATL